MRFIPILLVMCAAAAPQAWASDPVTFNHDIGPIIYRNCSPCHRPGEAAPFALLSYQDAVKKGKTIAKVTGSHVMPPWKAEPASYPYRDERRLTSEEIERIQAWVKADMPEGNAAEKPGIIKDLDGGYSSETIKNYLFPVSRWHNREGTLKT